MYWTASPSPNDIKECFLSMLSWKPYGAPSRVREHSIPFLH